MICKFLNVLAGMLFVVTAFCQSPEPTFKRITGIVDGYPMLSHDGRKILFESSRTGNAELFTMNLDGTEVKQVTFNSLDDHSPKWSPDGRLIVFAREMGDNSEVFIINADGTNEKRLTNQPGDDGHPNFSPDGQSIVFNSARTTPDLSVEWRLQLHEIFTMKTDGTNVRQLTTFKILCTYPNISPDGKKVCFRRVTNEPGFNYDLTTGKRNSEVFVMNMDGTNALNLSNNPAYDGWPTWTPDGKVLFSSNRGGTPYFAQLYLVNADGTDLKLVSDPKYSLIQATVTKDGKAIYCQHSLENLDYDNGGIAVVPLSVIR